MVMKIAPCNNPCDFSQSFIRFFEGSIQNFELEFQTFLNALNKGEKAGKGGIWSYFSFSYGKLLNMFSCCRHLLVE